MEKRKNSRSFRGAFAALITVFALLAGSARAGGEGAGSAPGNLEGMGEPALAEVAAGHRHLDTRLAALAGIEDASLLGRLAREPDCWKVRARALRMLDCQDLAAERARHDGHWMVRRAAVKITGDRELLARLAEEDPSPNVRRAALEKVDRPDLLRRVALEDANSTIREAAVRNLERPQDLEEVARRSLFPDTRLAAMKKADDPALWRSVATLDSSAAMRESSVAFIKDQSVLAEIAEKDESPRVRAVAVARLECPEKLEKILLEDGEWSVRRQAARQMGDTGLPEVLRPEERSAEERLAYIGEEAGPEMLARIAAGDFADRERVKALSRIEDEGFIRSAALARDESEEIRLEATGRLRDAEILREMIIREAGAVVAAAFQSAAVGGFIRASVPDAPGAARLAVEETEIPAGRDVFREWVTRLDPFFNGVEEGFYEKAVDPDGWTGTEVPSTWGSYTGFGWYRAVMDLPEETFAGKDLLLVFEGVDEQAWVFVNGRFAGKHSVASENLPIVQLYDRTFGIRVGAEAIEPGRENTLAVLVHASVGTGGIAEPVRAIPLSGN